MFEYAQKLAVRMLCYLVAGSLLYDLILGGGRDTVLGDRSGGLGGVGHDSDLRMNWVEDICTAF